MFFEIFKNKWFLIIWISISIIGGIWGYVKSKNRDAKLQNANEVICIDFRDNVYPSVLGIESLEYKDQYLDVLIDTAKHYLNFPCRHIENGQKSKVLEYTPDSQFVKIAIVIEKTASSRYRYEELWVWKKFLKYE
jgi:hypothetical protein